jgi:protein SCO1/2
LRLALLLALGLAIGLTQPAWADDGYPPDDERQPGSQVSDFEQRLGEQVPLDLQFTDENGRPVRLGNFAGARPIVLTLNYFHCPNFCSLVLDGLAERLEKFDLALGEDFQAVTVSIDPIETPVQAAAHKDRLLRHHPLRGAESWHFLTGDPGAISALVQAVGFRYVFDPIRNEFDHPTGLVVLTPEGRVARYLYGVEFAPRDLRLALVEAAQGRVGSPIDQVLLRCYRYDPATGQYSFAALNALRWAGAATALGLGVILYVLWRPDLGRPDLGRPDLGRPDLRRRRATPRSLINHGSPTASSRLAAKRPARTRAVSTFQTGSQGDGDARPD